MIDLLYDAAPYIGRFQGAVFVIKIGGEILLSAERVGSLARQVHVLWQIGNSQLYFVSHILGFYISIFSQFKLDKYLAYPF